MVGAATVWVAPVIQSFTNVAAAGSNDPTTPDCTTYALRYAEGGGGNVAVEDKAGTTTECIDGTSAVAGGAAHVDSASTVVDSPWVITLNSGFTFVAAFTHCTGSAACTPAALSNGNRTAMFAATCVGAPKMHADFTFTNCA